MNCLASSFIYNYEITDPLPEGKPPWSYLSTTRNIFHWFFTRFSTSYFFWCIFNTNIAAAAAAAAAKSLQLGLTLCGPMDSSPPGSPVHGVLQARRQEWVAISFSQNVTTRPYYPFLRFSLIVWQANTLSNLGSLYWEFWRQIWAQHEKALESINSICRLYKMVVVTCMLGEIEL